MMKYQWCFLKQTFISLVVFVLAAQGVCAAPRENPASLCIMAAGDIMPGTCYPDASYLPPNEGKFLLAGVQSILRKGDITFGNLEGIFLGNPHKKEDCVKPCKNEESCYAFRIPESYLHILSNAGFNLLSLANNHAGDFGTPGKKRTYTLLDNTGIHFAGPLDRPYAHFSVKGLSVGFMAFSPNRGMNDLNNPAAFSQISRLSSNYDILVISFHGGAEGAMHRHVPFENEYYYNENRGDVHRFAHNAVDAGADLVLGHGPHVTRAIELYKDRLIAYSLGNFLTYRRFNLEGPMGIAPILEIYLDRKGAFQKGKIHPVFQTPGNGPKPDPKKRVVQEIIHLTSRDFPKTGLRIHPNGTIEKKLSAGSQ